MKRKELLASLLSGEKKTVSLQTGEMNWKVLCHAVPESLSLLLSAEVNAIICVAKLHILFDKGNDGGISTQT